jgi:predicted DsbA family dithiol-disulfide isomerase
MFSKINFCTRSLGLSIVLATFQTSADSGGCVFQEGENPKVTIEKFSDFECSFCAKGSALLDQAQKDFPKDIKVVFRNFPLPSHPHAQVAAEAFTAICLQNPSLAHKFQKEIFKDQLALRTEGESVLFKIAKSVGANVKKMKADMKSDIVKSTLLKDKERAQELKISGTPSFRVGKETMVGAYPYQEMRRIIEEQMKKKK